MGKVIFVKAARKEWKCSKCGKTIEKGSSYYKGEINFGPTIVACKHCKLKGYEVTTSEYIKRVGRLCEDYTEDYSLDDSGVSMIIDELESIRDDCDEKLDNMPEGLREGDAGQLLQDRIDACDDAIGELENIDYDDVVSEALSEIIDDDDELEGIIDSDSELAEVMNSDKLDDSIKDDILHSIEDKMDSLISDALSSLEY